MLNILTLFMGDDFLREPSAERAIDYPLAAAGMLAALSVIWFWLRMLTDYFRHRPESHSVAWGWALFFLGFIAALAYFWYVWRPRMSEVQSANA